MNHNTQIIRAIEASLRHTDQVLIEDIAKTLRVTRADVVTACRALESRKAGHLVVGRRGHPSRFVREGEPLMRTLEAPPMHHIAIRPDLVISIPADLSDAEMADFVTVLEALFTRARKPASGQYVKTG